MACRRKHTEREVRRIAVLRAPHERKLTNKAKGRIAGTPIIRRRIYQMEQTKRAGCLSIWTPVIGKYNIRCRAG